jgi:trans-2-enoyl-CoA reductase
MKQIAIEQTGSPEAVAAVHEAPSPPLPPGHVRLRMKFAPVNPADLNFIEGTYGKKPVLPAVPGIEGVGEIIETAADVRNIHQGRLAIPLGGIGCWAEELVRPASEIFMLPEGMDPRQAAMLRVNPATAWGLLHAAGPLPQGAWVVQNGASSNCGHCVIQIARHRGLRTLNLVRRAESAANCAALGADAVLTDDAETVAAARALPGFTAPVLALNAVGGESALFTYGAMSRQPVKVPNSFLIFKDLHLRGYWFTKRLEAMTREEVQTLYAKLAGLVMSGELRQPVAAEYPLEEITAALRHAAGNARGGKVLLRL